MSELDELLVAHGGHFTWPDAVRAGVPRREITARVGRGELAHVGRGAYVEARRLRPEELHRRRTVALLRTHPGRIATHHSAAILLEMPVHQAALGTVHFGRSDTSAWISVSTDAAGGPAARAALRDFVVQMGPSIHAALAATAAR